MDTEEILERFSDVLNISNPLIDMIRLIGWYILKGFAWIVDSIEGAANTMLGLKLLYNHPEIVEFVESYQPVLVIIFALNLVFIGYLLMFKKDFNREMLVTNVIVALAVVVLIGSGAATKQIDRFATQSINAVDAGESDTVATKVLKDNITDVVLYDANGWESTELEETNNIPQEKITNISINQKIDDDFMSDNDISSAGEDVLKSKINYTTSGEPEVVKLENGFTTIMKEYYYRYDWNYWHMFFTLGVMTVVLVTVAIKLARLAFELAFNHVIAPLIAVSDVHSGQKTKQVIQNILSILIVMIMIFLSMKIFLIASDWVDELFTGFPYIVAMVGLGMAVMDGPNIVERLFGIDAGLKSGWGAVAGGYAVTKGLTKSGASLAKGTGNLMRTAGNKAAGIAGGAKGLADGLKTGKQKSSSALSAMTQANSNDKSNEKSNQGMLTAVQMQGKNGQQQQEGQNQKQQQEGQEGQNQVQGQIQGQLNSQSQSEKQQEEENGSANGVTSSDKPMSLHDQMKQQGYGQDKNQPNKQQPSLQQQMQNSGIKPNVNGPTPASTGTQSVNSATPASAGTQSVSSPTPASTGTQSVSSATPASAGTQSVSSPTPASTGTQSVSSPTPASAGTQSVSSSTPASTGTQSVSSDSAPITSTIHVSNDSPETSTNNISYQEVASTTDSGSPTSTSIPRNTETPQSNNYVAPQPTRERSVDNRHYGQVIKDRFKNTNVAQNTIRHYNIGRNTGKAIRKNFKRRIK